MATRIKRLRADDKLRFKNEELVVNIIAANSNVQVVEVKDGVNIMTRNRSIFFVPCCADPIVMLSNVHVLIIDERSKVTFLVALDHTVLPIVLDTLPSCAAVVSTATGAQCVLGGPNGVTLVTFTASTNTVSISAAIATNTVVTSVAIDLTAYAYACNKLVTASLFRCLQFKNRCVYFIKTV